MIKLLGEKWTMGVESFQTVLNFRTGIDAEALVSQLLKTGFVREDMSQFNQIEGSTYLVLEDTVCFLEAQVTPTPSDLRLSLRYAVCQLPNVDQIASTILWNLREQTSDAHFVDCDDGQSFSDFNTLSEFSRWFASCAEQKRKLWFADFPGSPVKTRCRDAFQHYLGIIE